MDQRTDPVEIIARVNRNERKQRALEVWIWKAGKAGWSVTPESSKTDEPGDECGIVDVEGLKYRINYSPRVRQRVAIVPPGAHAVAVVLGDVEPQRWEWEFAPAVWAEPIIGD